MELVAIALVAFVAATIAGVSGFGGAVVLLPVLVAALGARDAIVALTIAQLVGNGSRVAFNRRDVDTAVIRWFALGAIPLAVIGGLAFAAAPVDALRVLLGGFLLASVAWRRLRRRPPRRPPTRSFAGIGAVFAFLSAILGSVGPLMAPFFLAYGLTKAAYIGTEATATAIMHVTKLLTYGSAGVLATDAAVTGLALAPSMVAGSWVGSGSSRGSTNAPSSRSSTACCWSAGSCSSSTRSYGQDSCKRILGPQAGSPAAIALRDR